MGCSRKIILLWILFAGTLISSSVGQDFLEPQPTIYVPSANAYIQSACYDYSRKIAFIGTAAVNSNSSFITTFDWNTDSYGSFIPVDANTGSTSLDICVFDAAQNYVYFVPSAPNSDLYIYLTRVDVSSVPLSASSISYAALSNSAKLRKNNFGVLIQENVLAVVGEAVVRISVGDLTFHNLPSTDLFEIQNNTDSLVIFAGTTNETFITGVVDNQIGYFAISDETPARVFALNLTADGDIGPDYANPLPTLTVATLTIGPVKSSVYDSDRKLAYFWNSVAGAPSTVVRFYVGNMTQTASVTLGSNSKQMTVAVLDTVHGQMYIAGGETILTFGYVSQINLATFQLNPHGDKKLLDEQKDIKIGWLADNYTIYFGYGFTRGLPNTNLAAYSGIFPAQLPAVCPGTPECSGHGDCVYGACVCGPLNSTDQALYPTSSYYAGAACAEVNCKYDCTNNVTGFQGKCLNSICDCGANYTGDFCEIQRCPYNCSGNGFCNQTNYLCHCNLGWSGDACQTQTPLPCSYYKNCKDCLSDTSCGWCRTEGKCVAGDLNGPFETGDSGCTSWYFTQCPEVGMEFFGYLFSILAGIGILINMVSLVQEELNPLLQNKSSDLDIRETWWRNQRSVKTWLMVDEIQFAAITSMFAVKVPSLYFNFVTIFRWSVIGFPLPWSQRDLDTSRDTLSMDQYDSSILAKDTEVFFGSLFWLAMLVILTAVVFLVLRIFGGLCFSSSYGLKNFFQNRLVYTLIRIAMFAYFPFAVFTTYSFTVDSPAAIVISIVFLLAVHLSLAIYLWRIQPKSRQDTPRLFRPEILSRVGCLYHSYYVKRAWFQEIIFLRKLAMGAVIGLLQNFETAQLILLMIFQVAYLIAVLVLKPYLDALHMFVDISSCIGHIIMIALMFPFIGSLNLDLTNDVAIFLSVAIAAISMILQLICIGAFINNWMKMNDIGSFMDLVDRCRGRQGSGKGVDVELDLSRVKMK